MYFHQLLKVLLLWLFFFPLIGDIYAFTQAFACLVSLGFRTGCQYWGVTQKSPAEGSRAQSLWAHSRWAVTGPPRTSSPQVLSHLFAHASVKPDSVHWGQHLPLAKAWNHYVLQIRSVRYNRLTWLWGHIQTLISLTQKTFALHHQTRFLFLLVCLQ